MADEELFIRLYLDEDVHTSLASALRQQGYDVLHVHEADRRRLVDAAQLGSGKVVTDEITDLQNRLNRCVE